MSKSTSLILVAEKNSSVEEEEVFVACFVIRNGFVGPAISATVAPAHRWTKCQRKLQKKIPDAKNCVGTISY